MSAASFRALAGISVLVCAAPFLSLHAQAPNEQWRTIRTPHFDVHFPAALEPIARRGAGSAERSYARLAPLLKPARGRIDLVVTDQSDITNGFAWVSPTPRIVVYARPPVDERSLRFRDDWLDLVVQHELVHIFHLDRTRGWWRAAQWVFGRQPMLFPNAWAPSWLLEGLAVHYESMLGDGGRIEGRMLVPTVNAKAFDHRMPRFGAFPSSILEFPGGATAYAFGSMLVQDIGDRGGAGSVERFVDRSSGRVSPWSFERSARAAFGTTFAAQWRRFSDSVTRAVASANAGAPSHATSRELTTASWVTRFPRTAPDGRLLFTASNGRDETALYELPATLDGTPRRIARRNSLDANVARRDGSVVFAQSDWVDPWRLWSDLWLREANGRERALTRGARLFAPDARDRDGAIVAAQAVAGSTRLVRVSETGAITPITGANVDTTWSAPRWSHDGARIAATRWLRGGVMSIVVLDTLGQVVREVASTRGVVDEPAWTANDATLLFSANLTGVATVWQADLASGALRRVAAGVTSLDSPTPVTGGFVAIETRALGERLVRADLQGAAALGAAEVLPSTVDAQPLPPAPPADGAVHPYHPLRQLVPRYWMPSVESSDENRTRYGAWTGGSDIVGRHAWAASWQHEPVRAENTGMFAYRFAGFGEPLVDVAMQQTWDHTPLVDSANVRAGVLGRRRRHAGVALTVLRLHTRTSTVLSGGASMEWRDFVTDPEPLINRLGSPLYLQTLKYPTFSALAAWANTRAPILAFGPEDGISVAINGRWRWRTDDPSATRSATYIGTAAAYKSIGFLPGAWHHVVALRVAAGTADDRTNTEIEAGGVSGSSAELAPGVVVGDVQRAFFVRGFAPGQQSGIRALGASAEWRAPLAITNWGKGFVPFFAQRVALIGFADAGAAWCPAGSRAQTLACPRGETPREWMASVGGELTLDAAVLNYDTPYRLRLGYAKPVRNTFFSSEPSGSMYFSLGLSF
jgi:hypothetical protein